MKIHHWLREYTIAQKWQPWIDFMLSKEGNKVLKKLQKQIRKEEGGKIFSKIEENSWLEFDCLGQPTSRLIDEKIYQKIKEAKK